jgi:hypothetical protein
VDGLSAGRYMKTSLEKGYFILKRRKGVLVIRQPILVESSMKERVEYSNNNYNDGHTRVFSSSC